MKLAVAVFTGKADNRPRQQEQTWDKLSAVLMRHTERTEKDGPLWSPTLYRANSTRAKANVVSVSCLVLDFDNGTAPEEFSRGWDGLTCVMHTTHSHSEADPHWRVVFPFSQAVPVEEWPSAWGLLVGRFGGNEVDPSCKDASRIYYLPSCPPGAVRDAWMQEGDFLDPRPYQRRPVAELLQRAHHELPTGRNNAGMWLACQMRDNGYSQRETEDAHWDREVQREKRHADGRVDHYTEAEWLDTVRKAYGRGAREPWKAPGTNSAHPAAEPQKPSLISFPSSNSLLPENDIEPEWPGSLAPEAFHGIAGEIVRELAPETEADEAALLMNFLITFGNAVGRSPHGNVGPTRHGANLFGVLVGRTGDARKGTSWDPIKELFARAIPDYTEGHVHGSVASGEGLIAMVRDRYEKRVQIKDKKSGRMTMEFETVVEDEGVTDKRLLIVDSEMSGLLKVMNRSGNILSEQLRKAWETGDMSNNNKSSPMKASGAHVSLIGHITPDGIKKHLTETEAANGFANRFLWMLCKRSKELPEGGNLPLLNSHIIAIRQLVELASGKIMMKRDEQAKAIWAPVYTDLTRAGVGMFGELTARRAPIVLRLSLIYALLDGVSVILADHLLAALAVWERSEASVRFLFGDATGDPTGDALYEAMQNRPEGATRTDLHAALGRNRPVAEIDRALTALQRAGKARMQRQKGDGGREVEAWHAAHVDQRAPACGEYLARARAIAAEMRAGAYEYNEDNENNAEGEGNG